MPRQLNRNVGFIDEQGVAVMVFTRINSILVILCVFSIMPVVLKADPPVPISCIDSVELKVRNLRKARVPAKDIGIVLDFHGVFTNQVKEQHGWSE